MMDEKIPFENATLRLDGDLGDGDGEGKNRSNTQSRSSTNSNGSRTSKDPNKSMCTYHMKSIFSYKEGAFENAVEICHREAVETDIDGKIRGAWLLTEIDHWDNEKERIIILTDNSVLVVNFDFITMSYKQMKRLSLVGIEKLQVGDFIYPEKSLMPARNHGGIRLLWNQNQQLSFKQKWNPWASDIPYTTFAHHPLAYSEKERETVTYNVDEFYESLLQAINQAYRSKRPGEAMRVQEGPILIESYASLASMVHNQSHIGFYRERGGVSF